MKLRFTFTTTSRISPATRGKDMATKLNLYMKSGVAEYWLVDLEAKSIIQYAFHERNPESMEVYKEGSTVESAVFEGLALQVKDILAAV